MQCNQVNFSKEKALHKICFSVSWLVASLTFIGNGHAQQLSQLSPNEQSAEKVTIAKLLAIQTEAWNHGKLEQFMETYWKSDKLTFSAGGTTTRGWQATLDRYQKRYSTPEQMGQLNFDELEIELIENRTALVLGNWHLTLSDATKRHGNFSLVVNKVDGMWKIVHDHSSEFKQP